MKFLKMKMRMKMRLKREGKRMLSSGMPSFGMLAFGMLSLGMLASAVVLSSCSSDGGSGETARESSETVALAETDEESESISGAVAAEEPSGSSQSGAGAEEPSESSQSGSDAEGTSVTEGTRAAGSDTLSLDSNESVAAAREQVFEEMREAAQSDEERAEEVKNKSMPFGEAVMRYTLQVIGEEREGGYPVYIALHGGGGAPKEVNDSQWNQMQRYYLNSVKNGIYITPRGVRDTWDTHFNPESYPLYERLLENLSIHYNIDTNRVYLVGYSAGGDGVYQITPRLADRFAAVDMSAGHPNGVNLTNLYNTPIALQCGENDTAYDRNLETARYGGVLSDLASRYGRDGQPEGYTHRVFLHQGKEHAVVDNDSRRTEQTVLSDPAGWLVSGESATEKVNSNAIDFVDAYTRDPIPERIVWDLSVRAELSDTETFYWLRASKEVTEGVVVAGYDKETNTIHVEQNTANGPVYAMVNDEMLDLFQDIHVTTSDGQSRTETVTPSLDYIRKTIEERWDRNMVFAGEIALPACGVTAGEPEEGRD